MPSKRGSVKRAKKLNKKGHMAKKPKKALKQKPKRAAVKKTKKPAKKPGVKHVKKVLKIKNQTHRLSFFSGVNGFSHDG